MEAKTGLDISILMDQQWKSHWVQEAEFGSAPLMASQVRMDISKYRYTGRDKHWDNNLELIEVPIMGSQEGRDSAVTEKLREGCW